MNQQWAKQIGKWTLPLGLAIALSACGGNDKNAGSASPSATASPSSSPSASSASPSPSASPSASAATPSPSASESASAESAALNPGYKLYENADYHTSIQYPEDWTVQELPGVAFAIAAPLDGADDTFAENVNLVVQDLGGQEINADDYKELSKAQLKQTITNFDLRDEGSLTEAGVNGFYLDFAGQQGEHDLYWRQFLVLDGGKAYTLTYTAEEDSFDNYVDQVKTMLDSWTIEA